VIGTLAVDGWAVTFWYSEEGPGPGGRVRLFVCRLKRAHKTSFSQKLSILELRSPLTTNRKSTWTFQKKLFLDSCDGLQFTDGGGAYRVDLSGDRPTLVCYETGPRKSVWGLLGSC